MKENVAGASSATVVAGLTSASASSAPLTVEGATPKEVTSMEGSAPLSANAGSSRALVWTGGDLHAWGGPVLQWADRRNLVATLFTLDDAAEARD